MLADIHHWLDQLGCDALLVLASSARDPDLAPFVGPVHLGDSFLVVPRHGRPHLAYMTPMERAEAAATGLELLHPEGLEVERRRRETGDPGELLAQLLGVALQRCDVAPGRLALAGHGAAGTLYGALTALARQGWRIAAGNRVMLHARRRRSPRQLEGQRHAARGACAAVTRVAEVLAAAGARDGELWLGGERLRAGRLRREIARVLADYELEQPLYNIVSAGGDAAVPHSQGANERVLRAGESILVDLFPCGQLYADITRTFCVGEPPGALAAAHAAALAALAGAHRASRPGVTGWSLQEGVCAHLEAAGYPTPISHPGTERGYVHNLGHGVGFEIHELPSFRLEAGDDGILEVGDVFTLEPGIYEPEGGFGVRIEDLYLLTENGAENLTPLPHELDPGAWPPAPRRD